MPKTKRLPRRANVREPGPTGWSRTVSSVARARRPTNDPRDLAYQNLILALRHQDARKRRTTEAFADVGPVVYYLWRPPYIKIGHTSRLRQRLNHLRCSPTDILALQPGSAAEEAAMHEQFNAARAWGDGLGREHFWPTEALLTHVNTLRATAGMKPVVVRLAVQS